MAYETHIHRKIMILRIVRFWLDSLGCAFGILGRVFSALTFDDTESWSLFKIFPTHESEQYPQLRQLMVIDPSMKYVATCCAITHLFIACSLSICSFNFVIIYAIMVGTLFSNALTTAMHETVHDLAFIEEIGCSNCNKVFALFLNLFLSFPGIADIYQSHKYHHSHLGTQLDVKYPPRSEALRYDKNIIYRLIFIFGHPFLVHGRWKKLHVPKSKLFCFWNIISIIIFDAFLVVCRGWKPLFYLLLSSWLNDTVFVQGGKNYADHVTSDENRRLETYSYYGWFNYCSFNLGYHREHHDFPNVPGRYLPLIRSTAMEYYADDRFIQSSLFMALLSLLKAKPQVGITRHICLSKTD